MRITFEEVKVKGTRRWTENGKPRQLTRTFMQTVNPFNKHPNGRQKSRDEIVTEVRAERDAWLKWTPVNGN
jgi:hypothetical protein